MQDGSPEWVTVLACVCAEGSHLPPSLIFQSAAGAIPSRWVEGIKANEQSVHVTSSLPGWTNNDIGLACLEQVFDRHTKEKARQSYQLLILDGHGSHVTMDFIDYYDQKKILLAIFTPHSTQTLQPLDLCMFKPLLQAYADELSALLERSQGLSPIKKDDFFSLFWKAWVSSFKENTITNSFQATGISPLEPDVILQRFVEVHPDKQGSRESSASVLSGSAWRKIVRLVKIVVMDINDEETKKLSRSLHSISIQNELLEHENRGLREALANKQKGQKRSKLLDPQTAQGVKRATIPKS
jgi:hypothetical protein